jgi:hypothetical protein
MDWSGIYPVIGPGTVGQWIYPVIGPVTVGPWIYPVIGPGTVRPWIYLVIGPVTVGPEIYPVVGPGSERPCIGQGIFGNKTIRLGNKWSSDCWWGGILEIPYSLLHLILLPPPVFIFILSLFSSSLPLLRIPLLTLLHLYHCRRASYEYQSLLTSH